MWWLLTALPKVTGQRQGGRIQEMQFDERKSSGEFKVVAKMLSKETTKM